MGLQVGARLGQYDVTALTGEGSMGQVYQENFRRRYDDTYSNHSLLQVDWMNSSKRLSRCSRVLSLTRMRLGLT